MGADLLIGELKKLGLTRFLGGSKLNQLGMTYTQAGSTCGWPRPNNIPSDTFEEGVQARRDWSDRPWRFEDYAAS
jgi:hypothetical protein